MNFSKFKTELEQRTRPMESELRSGRRCPLGCLPGMFPWPHHSIVAPRFSMKVDDLAAFEAGYDGGEGSGRYFELGRAYREKYLEKGVE